MLALAVTACASGGGSDAARSSTTGAPAATTAAGTSPAPAATTGVAPPTAKPTGDAGELGVGRVELTFTDTSRPTPASRDQPATDSRVLDTVVWYPTGGTGPYALVVFAHGLGGDPENIADLAGDWVRAGLVVAAPYFPLSRRDHPGGPDAGDVQNQTGDVRFLIDELTAPLDPASPLAGMIDGGHVGLSGHSNGAITTLGATAHTCCRDTRIDAAIEIAGSPAPFAGGDYDFADAPPYMIVHGSQDPLVNYSNAITVYNSLVGPKVLVTIDGGGHEAGLGAKSPGHDAVAAATVDFWRAFLLGDDEALARLTAATTDDPSVRIDAGTEPGSTATVATVAPATDRKVDISPTIDLTGGQLVTVTWSGLLPGGTINIVQCSQGGTEGAATCDLTAGVILHPDPAGSGTIQLPIVVGAVGNGRCETGITDCVIVVNDSGLPDPEATIRIPLTFAS